MCAKLPPTVARLDLGEEDVFGWQQRGGAAADDDDDNDDDDPQKRNHHHHHHQHEEEAGGQVRGAHGGKGGGGTLPAPPRRSLLAPLRKRNGGGANSVCTAEAVVAALEGLGLPPADADHVLGIVKRKVDLTKRYRGKVDVTAAAPGRPHGDE